jgi:hypothetical protein
MGKTRKTRKTGNIRLRQDYGGQAGGAAGRAADYGSDRKHLTSREVEKPIDAPP